MENQKHTLSSLSKNKGNQVLSADSPETGETILFSPINQTPSLPPSNSSFENLDNVARNSLPSIDFLPAQLASFAAEHMYSFHAKVLGKSVKHQYLYDHLNRIWPLTGGMNSRELNNGFFLLKLSNFKDYIQVLEGIPWLIDDHYIVLVPWTTNFNPSQLSINPSAIWIRLPDLPVEYYHKQALLQIAEAIGKLVKIDAETERLEELKFARLCIVISLDNPLLPCMRINGFCQWIQYEGLHVLCYNCGRIGHLHHNCPHRLITSMPTITNSNPCSITSMLSETLDATHSLMSEHRNPSLYGPWLHVPSRTSFHNRRRGIQSKVSDQVEALRPDSVPSGSAADPASPHSAEMCLQSHKAMEVLNPESFAQVADKPSFSKQVGQFFNDNFGIMLTAMPVPVFPALTSFDPTQDSNKLPYPFQPSMPLSVFKEFSSSNDAGPSLSNPTWRKPDGVIGLFMPVPITVTSSPTEFGLAQFIDSNVPTFPFPLVNQSLVLPAETAFHQPSPMSDSSISFFCSGMLRSMKQREVKIAPIEATMLSNHCDLTMFNIEPKISTMDMDVSILLFPNGTAYKHKISMMPQVIDCTKFPLWNALEGICKKNSNTISSSHKLLSWNCLGAAEPRFIPAMRQLVELHQPSIVLLSDTRTSGNKANEIIKELGFSGSYRVGPIGFLGEIWLLWRVEEVLIEVTSPASQKIHAAVHFPSGYSKMDFL